MLGFVVPMCTLCVLYADLLRRLRALRLHSGAKALGKAAKLKVSLSWSWPCWPSACSAGRSFHLASIVALTTDLPQTPLVIIVSYVVTSLSYTSSCLNPFLYAFLDHNFRKSLRTACRCQGA